MLAVQNHISLKRLAFEISPFQRRRRYDLGSWNGNVSKYATFRICFNIEAFNRHCENVYVFERPQLWTGLRLLHVPQSEDVWNSDIVHTSSRIQTRHFVYTRSRIQTHDIVLTALEFKAVRLSYQFQNWKPPDYPYQFLNAKPSDHSLTRSGIQSR